MTLFRENSLTRSATKKPIDCVGSTDRYDEGHHNSIFFGGGAMEASSDDWSYVAAGVLSCIAAICITYIILRTWPRTHYPRFFALLAGVASVAAMYLLKIPGAGFALGAIAIMFYIALHVPDAITDLFVADTSNKRQAKQLAVPERSLGLQHLAFGVLLGLLLALAAVSAVVVPPSNLRAWVMHPDPLDERIRRAIDPSKEWTDLVIRERDARQALTKLQAETTALSKRAEYAEAELTKALDELGSATSNTVRAIAVKTKTGSRHANGLVYIGVDWTYMTESKCYMTASSDTVDSSPKGLKPGEALKLSTGQGSYRIILVGVSGTGCVFDLVKE